MPLAPAFRTDVAHPSGDGHHQYTGAQPQAVGIHIARWQVTQRLPELDIFEALLDLRTMGDEIVRVQGVVAGFGGVIRVMGRLGGLMARAGRGAR